MLIQARLGLSPAPLERLLGIKSLFSGMTEAVHQLMHFNFRAAIEANVFAPAIPILIVVSTLLWRVPKLDSKRKEWSFFFLFACASVVVNIFN